MDNISVNKAERLYWLGRYAERAYTLSCCLSQYYDLMIDGNEQAFSQFCQCVGIAGRYQDKNEFIKGIITDPNDNASIIFTLQRANDNAMVLRDEIKTETAAYMQLAYNDVLKRFLPECRVFDLQWVKDSLLAFWGAIDDFIIDDDTRNLIKAGKYTERIDLYIRFDYSERYIQDAKTRLRQYVSQIDDDGACKGLTMILTGNQPHTADQIDGYIINMLQ